MVLNHKTIIFVRCIKFGGLLCFRKSIIATDLCKFLNHTSRKQNWTTEMIRSYEVLFRYTFKSLFYRLNDLKSFLGILYTCHPLKQNYCELLLYDL